MGRDADSRRDAGDRSGGVGGAQPVLIPALPAIDLTRHRVAARFRARLSVNADDVVYHHITQAVWERVSWTLAERIAQRLSRWSSA